MKKKKLISLIVTGSMVGSFMFPSMISYATQFNNVMSIGANLTNSEKQEMVSYFNPKEGSYQTITINNSEEQQDLKGIIPESEIGTRTISCAYVEPTTSGGINVKTVNLTYVTASMISNALTTAGIYNANVIAGAPFKVSGTGALTGIINAFEKSSGQAISPEKKKLANKELEVTGNISNNKGVGQVKASAVVNGVKDKVIDDNLQNSNKIIDTINKVSKEYGVTLTKEQTRDLANLMMEIGSQKYNKEQMEDSLDKIEESLNQALDNEGQLNGTMNKVDVHVDSFINWFKGLFGDSNVQKAGIVNNTNNNSEIGKTAITTGSSNAIEGTKVAISKTEQTEVPKKEVIQTKTETPAKEKGNNALNTENLRTIEKEMAESTVTFLNNANEKVPSNLESKILKYIEDNATVDALNKISNIPLTNENIKYVNVSAMVTPNGGYESGYLIDMGKIDESLKGKTAQISIKVELPGKPVKKPTVTSKNGEITGEEFTQNVWYAVYKFIKDNPATATQYKTDSQLMDAIKQALPMQNDVLETYNAPFPENLQISCSYSDAIGRRLLYIPTSTILPMANLPANSNNIVIVVKKSNGEIFEPFQGA